MMLPSFFPKDSIIPLPVPQTLSCRTVGWIGNAERQVEIWSAPPGIIVKVSGGGDFYIAPDGETIVYMNEMQGQEKSGNSLFDLTLSELDREILLGPTLVLALALRDTWCLHASAAVFAGNMVVFPGESGQGKSTLAAYLSTNLDWHLVADDILPVRADSDGVNVLPHFPQLKLSADAQPGPSLPERLPLTKMCALTPAGKDTMPELQLLPPGLAIQVLLRHTAGTRMFAPEMLGRHLSFCSLVAGQVPVYQLSYPHRKDALPIIKELLENLC